MVYKSWGKIAIATACYAAAPPFFAAGPVPYVNTCVCIPSLRQIAVHVGTTLRSMTTFLGVWHQSLGVTSKWLRGRRGVRGGDSRLHCAVLPVVPLAGGRGSGYVARPPRKRAKTRQKPRTAPRCSVVSPCTGRNRASLRRSSEPLQASQARATLRRPAAPEDQSRRPRRTRLLPQERPRAEEAEVDVKMTPLSAETVRGS